MQNLHGEAELALAPAFAPPRPGSRTRRPAQNRRLEAFVETEILPRLLDAHPLAPPLRESAAAQALTAALLTGNDDAARAALHQTAAEPMSESRLMLEALAPAARRLGALWEDDVCDFFDVSRALEGLHALLAGLRRSEPPRRRAAPAMLLLTAPGETHRFGADMAAELLRREGWEVERGDASRLFRLSRRHFAALGISCACDRARDALPQFLAEARKLAGACKTAIGVGGALFAADPGLACQLGVDFAGMAPDCSRRVNHPLIEPMRL